MQQDLTPYHNYRLTVRVELINKPGMLAKVINLLAKLQVNLGGVDLVYATKDTMTRDITIDVANEEHGYAVTKKIAALAGVKVISASDQIFLSHLGGKISVKSKYPLTTRNRLSMVYTPGVGRVSQAIAKYPESVYNLTIKSNSVAIVTDGSAVLGLGNLGANAAIPVMEGKAMIFKEFANIDAWPICLDTQNEDEIIRAVELIAPVFGAINLEDISAPRCFRIEEALKKKLSIPVMHDDQHGTAVVILAALTNALKLVKKDLKKCKIVVNGLGAAGLACFRILLAAGVNDIVGVDKKGVVLSGKAEEMKRHRHTLDRYIDWDNPKQSLKEALKGADVFIGVSAANILKPQDLKVMKKNNIIFALANPDPEVDPNKAIKYCRIFATGRSDFPNQINNALVFPGIFRGALNVRAKKINEPMKLAAAKALANLITSDQLSSEYIIPNLFDKRVVQAISHAVSQAAVSSGVAQKKYRASHSPSYEAESDK
jgi:malate dehydrogenase (oxaloacetate-decarboxylating)